MIHNADCFDIFPNIENKSINLVLVDLPYGQIDCKWDNKINLDEKVCVLSINMNLKSLKKLLNSLLCNESNFKKLAESIVYYLNEEFPLILDVKIKK